MSSSPGRPVRVAVVDDYEIVVAGIAAVLAPYAERVVVVGLDAGRAPSRGDLDVVLYDTFGQTDDELDVEALSAGGTARVVVFSWDLDRAQVTRALGQGAAGYLAKSLPAEEIVAALERVHAGETVVPAEPTTAGRPQPGPGFTHRETEIVALIAQGLSNQEIADRLFLSINSVKSYIRSSYRKMEVSRRSQAVGWALAHGFGSEGFLGTGHRR